MARPLSRLTAAFAVCATLVVAGCGSGSGGPDASDDPKGALVAGISQLGEADTLTTTLQLDTTPENLQVLAGIDGDNLSDANAKAIASAQLVMQTSKDKAFALRGVDNGNTLFELRSVDKVLYLQGDLEGVLDIAGKPDALADVKAQAAQLPSFVQAFVNGDWVSINSEALAGLAGSLGVPSNASPSDEQGPKMLAELRRAVDKDVTVKDLGEEADGEHLRLTGNVKDLATDLQNAVQSTVPGGAALSDQFDPSDAPNQTITVDAWLQDDALSKLSLDLAQFASDDDEVPAGTTLPIVLTFEQAGDAIEAPADATPVDLSQLGSLMGAFGGGISG
jgi:hypothetical protein